MSDWERIFGAGVSAESVIGGINASWSRQRREEGRDEEKLAREQHKALLSAFLGSEAVKSDFISKIAENRAGIKDFPFSRGLLRLLYPVSDPYFDIQEHFRIPPALAYIIDELADGLRHETPSWASGNGLEIECLDWFLGCFDSIEPGVDLRLVAPQFLANIARSSLRSLSHRQRAMHSNPNDTDTLRKCCRPAVDVIYARSRGVLVQDDLVGEAAQLAWSVLSKNWTDGASTGDDAREDFGVAAISCAANLSPEVGARALRWAAYSRWEAKEYGDADLASYYRDYGEELLELITSAPSKQVRIVDLNDVSASLGNNPQLSSSM